MLSLLLLVAAPIADLTAQVYPGRRLVTYQRKNISYSDFFNVIYTQTQMLAFYNEEQVASDEIVSVNFQEAPLDTVLASLIGRKGLGWCYKQGTFVVSYLRREELNRTITGLIVNEKGQPLDAAAINANGSLQNTGTAKDGRFILRDVPPGATLTVRRAGYKPMELTAYADSVFVQLVPIVSPLKAVDITGGIQKWVTGSVSSIDEEEIAEQPASNVLSTLQGRVPGLYINQTTGLPGGGYRIRLRGRNSLESVSDPLILVDGIPFPAVSFNEAFFALAGQYTRRPGENITASPLNLLTISDIARVDVLKDADATSIYGAKGVNGIISITTRAPNANNKGFNANIYSGAGQAAKLIRYMDTKQYLEMRREGIRNDGQVSDTIDHDLTGTEWDTTAYTDWQKKMIGNTAHVLDANLDFNGGHENMYYRLSGSYRQESTVYPSPALDSLPDFGYKKYGLYTQFRFNSNNKRLQLNFSGSYTGDVNRLPNTDLTVFSTLPPNIPYQNTPSLYFDEHREHDNPYAYFWRTSKTISTSFRSYVNGIYTLSDDWELNANMGFSSIKIKETQVNPASSFNPEDNLPGGYSFFFNNRHFNGLMDFSVRWKKGPLTKQVSWVGGVRLLYEQQRQKGFQGYWYQDDKLLDRRSAAPVLYPLIDSTTYYNYKSFYSRIEYKLAHRYMMALTATADLSSRLKTDKPLGFFAAASAGWLFSKAALFSDNRILSYGKLRASFGISGNDQFRRDINKATYIPDALVTKAGYNWEKVRKWELAMELGLFNDRIYSVLCYYNNRSSNQLVTTATRGMTNHNIVIQNRGFELDLETRQLETKTISWTSSFNLSFPQNKLLYFDGFDGTHYVSYYSQGKALDMVNTYGLTRVEPKTGYYEFEKSGTKAPGEKDKRVAKELDPEFYGGFQHNLQVKQIELNILFRFARQNNYNYQYGSGTYSPGGISNQPLTVENHWHKPGDIASVQKYSSSREGAAALYPFVLLSDKRITAVNYLRLQSLMMAYHIPEKTLKQFKIKSCKLYLQGLNLFTISNYEGRDPELVTAEETYPSLRIMTAGIQVSL